MNERKFQHLIQQGGQRGGEFNDVDLKSFKELDSVPTFWPFQSIFQSRRASQSFEFFQNFPSTAALHCVWVVWKTTKTKKADSAGHFTSAMTTTTFEPTQLMLGAWLQNRQIQKICLPSQ